MHAYVPTFVHILYIRTLKDNITRLSFLLILLFITPIREKPENLVCAADRAIFGDPHDLSFSMQFFFVPYDKVEAEGVEHVPAPQTAHPSMFQATEIYLGKRVVCTFVFSNVLLEGRM
jgi:hypothetical protein